MPKKKWVLWQRIPSFSDKKPIDSERQAKRYYKEVKVSHKSVFGRPQVDILARGRKKFDRLSYLKHWGKSRFGREIDKLTKKEIDYIKKARDDRGVENRTYSVLKKKGYFKEYFEMRKRLRKMA